MKKLVMALAILGLLSSCKGDKIKKTTNSTDAQNKNVTMEPAVRDGNVVRQKVTVGGNQNQNMNIDASTALQMIKDNPQAKVLDVRTPKEVADGIFPNAMHLDINRDDFKTEINKLDKNDTYIVYCKSGGRSGKAVKMMRAFGFNKSYNMKDGYTGITKASKK